MVSFPIHYERDPSFPVKVFDKTFLGQISSNVLFYVIKFSKTYLTLQIILFHQIFKLLIYVSLENSHVSLDKAGIAT